MNSPYRDVHFITADGLRLYARDYRHGGEAVPVLCLPGLTRSSRDFEPTLAQLAASRRVIAMDFRGRGKSDFAVDPLTYRVDVEAEDAIGLLDHLAIDRVAIIGTSRGGLVATLLAVRHRHRVAGIVLNDIGPVLERPGLLRIRSYLGHPIDFRSFEEAADALRSANPGFKGMSDAEWMAFARRLYRDDDGTPRLDYDPRLAATFPTEEQINAGLVPPAWPLFQALLELPVALLRGTNSDLLSRRTVNSMKKLLPDLLVASVPKRGHAPFLDEPAAQGLIAQWLERVDAA